jgi:hypothetical protein
MTFEWEVTIVDEFSGSRYKADKTHIEKRRGTLQGWTLNSNGTACAIMLVDKWVVLIPYDELVLVEE